MVNSLSLAVDLYQLSCLGAHSERNNVPWPRVIPLSLRLLLYSYYDAGTGITHLYAHSIRHLAPFLSTAYISMHEILLATGYPSVPTAQIDGKSRAFPSHQVRFSAGNWNSTCAGTHTRPMSSWSCRHGIVCLLYRSNASTFPRRASSIRILSPLQHHPLYGSIYRSECEVLIYTTARILSSQLDSDLALDNDFEITMDLRRIQASDAGRLTSLVYNRFHGLGAGVCSIRDASAASMYDIRTWVADVALNVRICERFERGMGSAGER